MLKLMTNNIKDKNKYKLLLIGEFNASLNGKKQTTDLLKHFELVTKLKQIITAPTRIAKQTKTTIDLAFTNIKYCTGSGVLSYNISDHKPIYIVREPPYNEDEHTEISGSKNLKIH